MENKIIYESDFNELEDARRQIDEFFRAILGIIRQKNVYINKKLNFIIDYTGRPFHQYFTKFRNTYQSLKKESFSFSSNFKGQIYHLVRILNFSEFLVTTINQLVLQLEQGPGRTPINGTVWKLKKINLIKDGELRFIDYRDYLDDKYLMTNNFYLEIHPFYEPFETVWYTCGLNYEVFENYIKRLVRVNTPIEFIFNVKVFVGEPIKRNDIIDEEYSLKLDGSLNIRYDSDSLQSRLYESVLGYKDKQTSNWIDVKGSPYRQSEKIFYDPVVPWDIFFILIDADVLGVYITKMILSEATSVGSSTIIILEESILEANQVGSGQPS